MTEENKTEDVKPGDDRDPRVLEEPGTGEQSPGDDYRGPPDWEIEDEPENPWMRGLWVVVLAVLFGVGQAILLIGAVLQFLWLVFGKEKNQNIADFGKDLADWLARVALFQTGATEQKPFPFARWGGED